ncbi:hypothetical protein [Acinetobacter guillouiae]|uniref:hypothetical protein n=1 Tax=Acinetobacter guillouiae TaxID=106649 RepID=UPI003C6EED4C
MKPNIPKHPCANKCTDFKGEQCKTCLVQELPSHKSFEVDFLPGDVVVLTSVGTKDELLEIIEHKYTDDLYRVKILSSGACGPVFKNEIRPATTAEIQANRRLTEAELALAEVS